MQARRLAVRAALLLAGFVAAVNLVWFVAPTLGDPGVYRPLGGILIVVTAATAWQKTR